MPHMLPMYCKILKFEYIAYIFSKYEYFDSDKLSEENLNYLISLSVPVEYAKELDDDTSFTKM